MPTRFATSPGAKIPFLTFTGIAPKNDGVTEIQRPSTIVTLSDK